MCLLYLCSIKGAMLYPVKSIYYDIHDRQNEEKSASEHLVRGYGGNLDYMPCS